MKRNLFLLCAVSVAALVLAACDSLVAAAPEASPAPVVTAAPIVSSPTADMPPAPTKTALPAPTIAPTVEPTSEPTVSPVSGVAVSFDRLSLTVPTGVASGASGTLVDKFAEETGAWWELAPAHIELKLDGYALQGKIHQPQIYVYLAEEYAQMQEGAAQSLERLRAVLSRPSSTPLTTRDLPAAPIFNSVQAFASHVEVIPFHHGKGVRELTQYNQGLTPVNNSGLIYQFAGLTDDGKYFVIAILPVTVPVLPEDGQPGTAVPEGGVPTLDLNSGNPDWQGYIAKVQQVLDGMQPGAFTPMLDQLDALIGTVSVASGN